MSLNVWRLSHFPILLSCLDGSHGIVRWFSRGPGFRWLCASSCSSKETKTTISILIKGYQVSLLLVFVFFACATTINLIHQMAEERLSNAEFFEVLGSFYDKTREAGSVWITIKQGEASSYLPCVMDVCLCIMTWDTLHLFILCDVI